MASTSASASGSLFASMSSPFFTSPSPALAAAEAAAAPFLTRGFLDEEVPTFPVRLATLVGVLGLLATGPSPLSVEFLLPPPFNWEQRRE